MIYDPKNDGSRRVKQLLSDIERLQPDIVAIQGGHSSVFDEIIKGVHKSGMKRYIPDEFKDSRGGNFTDLILTSLTVLKTVFVPFYCSSEGRGMTMVILDMNGTQVMIATCRLEQSAEFGFNKAKQISYIFKHFSTDPHVVFAGDTNLFSYQRDPTLSSGWSDAWVEVGRKNNELTYDHERNQFAAAPCRDRRDRVWYKGMTCDSIHLVGGDHLMPTSSHFGVFVELRLN